MIILFFIFQIKKKSYTKKRLRDEESVLKRRALTQKKTLDTQFDLFFIYLLFLTNCEIQLISILYILIFYFYL